MTALEKVKSHLKEGAVYRRNELAQWSASVDRHLNALVQDGTLEKLSQGIYHVPQKSVFGKTPPEEQALVRSFLKDDRFLLTSPNAYNSLGVGTTQLYNTRIVYNHKRHGEFVLGNTKFEFRMQPYFPEKITPEFLLVDLVNNLDTLAEDRQAILNKVLAKIATLDASKLQYAVQTYGKVRTKKLLLPALQTKDNA